MVLFLNNNVTRYQASGTRDQLAAAIKPDVQCSELDRYEVAALPTRVSESEDRVIKHQRNSAKDLLLRDKL